MKNYNINPDTRVIEIPKGMDVLGVFHDNAVDGAHFTIEGDIVEKLKTATGVFINFILSNSDDVYHIPVTNLVKGNKKMEFDWILNRFATQDSGKISFIACFKLPDDEEWNTTVAVGRILDGIEQGELSPDEPPEDEDETPDGREVLY